MLIRMAHTCDIRVLAGLLLAGSPGRDRTLKFGGEGPEVLGELVEQLSFLFVGRKVPDQLAFGHLDAQPFQMRFHVLHRKRPRSRSPPRCQPRPWWRWQERQSLLISNDRRGARRKAAVCYALILF